jgi:hypothetical protein
MFVVVASVSFLGGCPATQPPPVVVAKEPPRPSGLFAAELAPIAALAWTDPFLWIGSARGLRRFRPTTGEVEWMTGDAGLAGHRITALAVGGDATSVLVGTEAGLGRVTEVAGKLVFQPLGTLAGITRLAAAGTATAAPPRGTGAAVTAGAAVASGSAVASGVAPSPAVWLGTDHGLFFFDGATLAAVASTAKNAIAFLRADPDGHSAWVGVPGRGLLHVTRSKLLEEIGPAASGAPDFVDGLGMGMLSNGTPFAIGRGRDGSGRLMLLHQGGPTLLEVEPSIRIAGIAPGPDGPVLFAGAPDAVSTYTLIVVERGQGITPGAFRFGPARKALDGLRVVAIPEGRRLPTEVTTYAWGANDVFFGTRSAGVARLGTLDQGRPVPPVYLPVGEIAWKARALDVACLERERCVVATGAGPGWIWDGATKAILPVPSEALGSPLMAMAGDGSGAAVYFMAGDGPKGIKVARLSADGRSWDPLLTVPVDTEGSPLVSYATVSPQGNLWMAVRDHLPSGEEIGNGIIELQLPSGKSIHHHATHAGQAHSPDAIPLSGDVRAIAFQAGTGATPDATWFCTSLGVLRVEAGKKQTHWSENDGLASDSCEDLKIVADGTVWVATREGVAHFDGKSWLPFDGSPRKPGGPPRWPSTGRGEDDPDGDPAAARAFVTVGGKLWAGTSRGVWPVTGTGRVFDARTGLIDSDVVGMTIDRFGRLWVLGHLGLTMTDTFPLSSL